jgi:hypothetical protein
MVLYVSMHLAAGVLVDRKEPARADSLLRNS